MAITVDPDFAWVLLVAVFISAHCLLQGLAIGAQRKKHFSKKFFEENFPKLVKDGDKYPKGGYPDMGNGRYSEKLSLEAWTEFNNAQRAHYNYLEGVATILVVLTVAGLFFPRFAALCGVSYIFGRVLYGYGYKTKGAHARGLGALFFDVPLLLLAIASIYGIWSAAGGVAGLKKFALGA